MEYAVSRTDNAMGPVNTQIKNKYLSAYIEQRISDFQNLNVVEGIIFRSEVKDGGPAIMNSFVISVSVMKRVSHVLRLRRGELVRKTKEITFYPHETRYKR